MTPKTKRWLVSALFMASLGIWVPQFPGMGASEPGQVDPDEVVPAFVTGDAEAAAALEGAAMPVEPVAQEAGVASGAQAQSGGTNPLLESLARSLARLESSAQEPDVEVDDLARSWKGAPTGPTPAPSTLEQLEPAATPAKAATELETWLADHPLRLVLVGPRERIARLGSLPVREGDELLSGVTVERIEAVALVLATPGGARRIPLAALETRASPTSSPAPTVTAPPSADSAPAAAAAPAPLPQ
jgi:hypothetical protein